MQNARVILVALASLVVAGCHDVAPAAPPAPTLARAEIREKARGASLDGYPDLLAEVRGPSAVSYASTSVGLNDAEVAIVLRNVSGVARAIGAVKIRFAVRREGVEFRCEAHDEEHEREPRVLAEGETFAFVRTMHCWTPIPGRYDVQPFVALGSAPYTRAEPFTMAVESDAVFGPRACPARPGLFAAMGGDRRSPPMPMRREGRAEGYRAVIVVANGSAHAVAGGPVKLAFLVTKKGSDLTCGGETIARTLPPSLAPGEVSVLRVPVECIREVEGDYVVKGQLAFDEPPGSDAIEIGRMGVRVTSDPLLLWPIMP
jgi:hypothetical protein